MADAQLARMQRRLAAIPVAVKEGVQKSLVKQAGEMAETMRRNTPVKTGDLRDSIAVTPGGVATPAYSQPGGSMTVPANAVAITVGDHEVRYGHLVEYGTVNNTPHQFFWPTVRLFRKRVQRAVKAAVGRAVKKNASGK